MCVCAIHITYCARYKHYRQSFDCGYPNRLVACTPSLGRALLLEFGFCLLDVFLSALWHRHLEKCGELWGESGNGCVGMGGGAREIVNASRNPPRPKRRPVMGRPIGGASGGMGGDARGDANCDGGGAGCGWSFRAPMVFDWSGPHTYNGRFKLKNRPLQANPLPNKPIHFRGSGLA